MSFNNAAYQAIADTINDQRRNAYAAWEDGTAAQAVALATVEQLAERMCSMLAARHRGVYGFKRDRFMKACGF